MTLDDFLCQPAYVDLSTPRARVGDSAPEVRLPALTVEQDTQAAVGPVVCVSEEARARTVALIFGSYSCDLLRRSLPRLEEMAATFSERVAFFVVYTKEAHPEGGFVLQSNRRSGVAVEDPPDLARRALLAARLVRDFGLSIPVLLDGMDCAVTRSYGGFPLRLCLVGADGRIVYQGGVGPFCWEPSGLATAIRKELRSSRP